jgi:hypothetical protein
MTEGARARTSAGRRPHVLWHRAPLQQARCTTRLHPAHRSMIVIADDHPVVRAGLRLLLEAEDGLEVRADAGDVPTTGSRAISLCVWHRRPAGVPPTHHEDRRKGPSAGARSERGLIRRGARELTRTQAQQQTIQHDHHRGTHPSGRWPAPHRSHTIPARTVPPLLGCINASRPEVKWARRGGRRRPQRSHLR